MKAILDLSIHYGEGPIQIHELARRTDTPIKFLEQVLLDLKRAGFVESRRGKEGGYLLARPPAKITVGEVIRYVDGPVEPIACLADGYSSCADVHRCVLKDIWQEVAVATSRIIDGYHFEMLAQRYKQKQEVLEYVI